MPQAKTSSSHSMMMPVLPSTHSVMMQSTPTHQIIVTMSTKARPTHSVMIHEQHMSSSKVHATASSSASASASASATPSPSADAADPLGGITGMLDSVPILGGLLKTLGG
jgi:hypothetical protein